MGIIYRKETFDKDFARLIFLQKRIGFKVIALQRVGDMDIMAAVFKGQAMTVAHFSPRKPL